MIRIIVRKVVQLVVETLLDSKDFESLVCHVRAIWDSSTLDENSVSASEILSMIAEHESRPAENTKTDDTDSLRDIAKASVFFGGQSDFDMHGRKPGQESVVESRERDSVVMAHLRKTGD